MIAVTLKIKGDQFSKTIWKIMNNVQSCRYHGIVKFYSNTRKKSSVANLHALEKVNINGNPKK